MELCGDREVVPVVLAGGDLSQVLVGPAPRRLALLRSLFDSAQRDLRVVLAPVGQALPYELLGCHNEDSSAAALRPGR